MRDVSWTNIRPTKTGFYWACWRGFVELVEVRQHLHSLHPSYYSMGSDEDYVVKTSETNTILWLGPIGLVTLEAPEIEG